MSETAGWQQANVSFTDRNQAVLVATTQIGPLLAAAESEELIISWFFVRKAQWRFRYLPASRSSAVEVAERLTDLLGQAVSWSFCEFEELAFGGPAALTIACDLFHADSDNLLSWIGTDRALGQCETTTLLCSALFRSAGLEWFEQGDVWARVARLRSAHRLPEDPDRVHQLTQAMLTLMTVDPAQISRSAQLQGPWVSAFVQAGCSLAALNQSGQLHRGLRDVLAHHVIFHANRAGLTTADQGSIARLAVQVIFHM